MSLVQLIRAVSWNLSGYGKYADAPRHEQHELLRSLRPDIVCLQEIYSRDESLAELDQLVGEIAGALGMAYLAVPARHSHCHLAILWRDCFPVVSRRVYDLLLWHGLGVVELDAGVALAVAVTHLGPWDPVKQLQDTYTLTGQLSRLDGPVLLGADWNSFGADPHYDPEPAWSTLPAAFVERHIRFTDPPEPPCADRRPAQMMQRSGFHDAATVLDVPWKATGGHRGGWSRREDVFWTTQPAALRRYQVIDTPAARRLSDHLPIVVDLDPAALKPATAGPSAIRPGPGHPHDEHPGPGHARPGMQAVRRP